MRKITAVFLVLCLAVPFSGCNGKKEKISLYYGSSDKRSLSEETAVIDEPMTLDDEATTALEKLLAGPSEAEHTRVIPEGTNLISLRVKDRTATVNLSQEFEKSDGNATRLLALYSVVATLCAVDGINRTQILVNGRPMKYASTGEDIGLLSMNNVVTDDEIRRNQTAVVELYFGSEDGTGLVKQQRMIDVNDNDSIEKTIINELLAGPSGEGTRLIPADVKLLSVERKDKLSYVNLSKEFAAMSEKDAYLAVYSVVNTLTGQWRQSEGVQILIEGERTDSIGGVGLSEPLAYNENIVRGN